MLNMNLSRIDAEVTRPLLSTVNSVAEGRVMVKVMENGQAKVQMSQGGVATELFAGIARTNVMTPDEAAKVEHIEVPAANAVSGTVSLVNLAKDPIDAYGIGVLKVVETIDANGDKSEAITAFTLDGSPTDGVPHAGKYTISGTGLSFNPADRTDNVDSTYIRVVYRFAVSLTEARMLYSQGLGDAGQSVISAVGCVTQAQALYTDAYDPTDNWAAGGPVYAGASGMLTLKAGSTNTRLTNVHVLEAPQSTLGNNGFLGISILS